MIRPEREDIMNALKRYVRYSLPLAAIIAVSCFMALMMYPMMNANIKELPVAILSLDEGASTAQGNVNMGGKLVDRLTGSQNGESGDTPTMAWTEVDTEAALKEGFDNRDYYAAITIPKDFTAKTVAAQQTKIKTNIEQAGVLAQAMDRAQSEGVAQGLAGAQLQQYVQASVQKTAMEQASKASTATQSSSTATPTITLTVDNAKSPLVASLLKSSIPTMLGQSGATVKVETLNKGGVKTNSALPTAAMVGQNVIIMPTYMMSLLVSVLIVGQFGRKRYDDKAQRWVSFGKQLCVALGWSLIVSLGACCALAMVGAGFPPAAMIGFLWLSSFAIMSVLLGLMNISKPFGVACGAFGLAFGMTSGMLPFELLPGFWQHWIYDWVPQHFLGEGVRDVLYRGMGWWTSGSEPMMIILCVGLLLFLVAGLVPIARHSNVASEDE